MGFEPTRAEPIGLAVQRLNHSATSSLWLLVYVDMMWGSMQPFLEKIASAGNRTRINCLEGSYADHYTTDASWILSNGIQDTALLTTDFL